MNKDNPDKLQPMKDKMQAVFEENDDARQGKIQPNLIPIIIIGTKFDVFAKDYDTQIKKQLCMALRYMAHVNGCDLVFGSVVEKGPSKLYRNVLSSHTFDVSTKQMPMAV